LDADRVREQRVAVADRAQQLGGPRGRAVPGQPRRREAVEVERTAGEARVDRAGGERRPAFAVVLGRQPRGQLLLARALQDAPFGGRRRDVAEQLDQLLARDPFDEVQDGHPGQTTCAGTG